MAVTSHVYPNFVSKLLAKAANSPSFTTDTFAAGLCTGSSATWGATQQAYVFVSDFLATYVEVTTGGGYTSGYASRQALTTFTVSNNSPAGACVWTCTAPAPISFGASTTITARTMFLYDKTANAAAADTSSWAPVIIDFGVSVSSTAGAFTYTVDATNGLAVFTSS
jgi:hypothetical protein